MYRTKYLLETVQYFLAIFLFMLILSPNALSATKKWRYTIVNHTDYDIVVSHENCINSEWSGGTPCSNFNDIDKILLFDGWSLGGLFWLVKGYFSSILHQKAGAGDATG